MFQIKHSIQKLSILPKPNFINVEIVRWRRKPRWLPVAKSKMFKVPPRPDTSIEEKLELQRLYNNYHTQIKSLRRFLTNEYTSKLVAVDPEVQAKIFDEDFSRCSAINNKWNEEVKLSREKRVAEEFEREKEIALQRIIEKEEIQRQKLEIAEQEIRLEKEHSKTFITPDKLDAAIEYALANPVDYNYSIDMDGTIIHGRETKPPQKTTSK